MDKLKEYFSNLLILQYKNKPRAKATVEALTEIAFGDTQGKIFPTQIQEAYDLDTATGKQLDVIGKYIGYDRVLPIPIDDTFKYADYSLTFNPNTGYSDYNQQLNSYPYAEYRYSKYDYYSMEDEPYRLVLKMISRLKNKALSLGNIDRVLNETFDGLIYVIEKPKEVEYHIAKDYTPFEFLDTQDKLNMFFGKYFPRPMGCTITVIRDPYFLNLIPHGGAENYIDSDFIFTRTTGDTSIFFETPQKYSFYHGSYINDTFEFQIKVKINSAYQLSGFCTTFRGGDYTDFSQMEDFSVFKRRVTSSFSMTSGYNNIIDLFNYSDYVDQWVTLKFVGDWNQTGDQAIIAYLIQNGTVMAEVNTHWQVAFTNCSFLFALGFGEPLIGSIDFKECYLKLRKKLIWTGITNKRLIGV